MTTQVVVLLPKPNHQRVRVSAHYINADGSLGEAYKSVELEHGQATSLNEFYVHSSSAIRVEEIT